MFVSLAFCAFGATDTATEQGLGFLKVNNPIGSTGISTASNVLVVNVTPVQCPPLPHGTLNIYVTAWNGDVLIGNKDDLASGTMWHAAGIIASGTTQKIDGIISQHPQIWFCANSGNPTVIIAAWGTE